MSNVIDNDYKAIANRKINNLDRIVSLNNDSLTNLNNLHAQLNNRLFFTSPLILKNFLDSQDKITNNPSENEQFLMNYISNLYPNEVIFGKDPSNVDYDTLQYFVEFSNLYWSAADLLPERKVLFRTIASSFTNKIAKSLIYFENKNKSIMYNNKFRFMSDYCNLKSVTVNIKLDSYSKFFLHFSNQRWAHILNATWDQSSLTLKLLISLILMISAVSYVIMVKHLILKVKSIFKRNNEK
jgi:hypothetical protein